MASSKTRTVNTVAPVHMQTILFTCIHILLYTLDGLMFFPIQEASGMVVRG